MLVRNKKIPCVPYLVFPLTFIYETPNFYLYNNNTDCYKHFSTKCMQP